MLNCKIQKTKKKMFQGQYKKKSVNGTDVAYKKGDTVLFHGKIYECIINTILSPQEKKEDWAYKGLTENYTNANPPLNPKEGQVWLKDGRRYIYYYDKTNYSWVEF